MSPRPCDAPTRRVPLERNVRLFCFSCLFSFSHICNANTPEMLPITVLPVQSENHPGLRRAVRRGANGKGYSMRRAMLPTHKNLPKREKVKDAAHFPGRDSAHNGARSFRDRCTCSLAAIIGRKQMEIRDAKSHQLDPALDAAHTRNLLKHRR